MIERMELVANVFKAIIKGHSAGETKELWGTAAAGTQVLVYCNMSLDIFLVDFMTATVPGFGNLRILSVCREYLIPFIT